MKIKAYYFLSDGQDGSAGLKLFRTEKEAQAAEDEELEACGQIFNEAIGWTVIDTDDFEEIEDGNSN